jgi:Luciferase-like monooxygenase
MPWASPGSHTWNTFYGDLDHYRHLLDVLARHCAEVGRDSADVRKSLNFRAVLDEGERAARERVRELYGDPPPERLRNMMVVGTPEECVERLRRYAELGVGDFLLGRSLRSTGRRSSLCPARWRRRSGPESRREQPGARGASYGRLSSRIERSDQLRLRSWCRVGRSPQSRGRG